jgi:hypothetical protein
MKHCEQLTCAQQHQISGMKKVGLELIRLGQLVKS